MAKHELIAELRGYVDGLGGVAKKIRDLRRELARTRGLLREAVLGMIALRLSDYYTSCERMFERLSDEMNGARPEGEEWHRILLERMTREVPEVRPRVLSDRSHRDLDELRKLRHALRHLYGVEIDEPKLRIHFRKLPELHREVTADLNRFLNDLSRTFRAAEEDR